MWPFVKKKKKTHPKPSRSVLIKKAAEQKQGGYTKSPFK